MPKQVQKWEADCGGFYETEAEAIAVERKALFDQRLDELYDQLKSSRPCDQSTYDRIVKAFVWKHREIFRKLLEETS